MADAGGSVRRASIEAGAGRPFRFSLVLEDERGALLYWLGGRWAFALGTAAVSLFGLAGSVAATLADPGSLRPAFARAGAGVGAVGVSMYLRTRKVVFERRSGTLCWREPWSMARPGWVEITEEVPLRLERNILSTVEGWTLYAGTVRLFSYLGDPSIARSVSAAFQTAGVPLRTVIKRNTAPVEE